MMNKKNIVTTTVFLIIIGLSFAVVVNLLGGFTKKQVNHNNELEIKTNKETIYQLFNNFPESNNIYYCSNNLDSKMRVGPTIYQIDILAELKDEAYSNFVNQVEFEELDNFEIKVNPYNKSYNWKKIKNANILISKDNEVASVKSIYLDENTKTIYVVAVGGN